MVSDGQGARGIKVIFDDPDFAVISKPAGLLVHKTGNSVVCQGSDRGDTVADWVVWHYPTARRVGDCPASRPGIVHRLDRETSGVMVVAKTQQFFNRFKRLLQEHKVRKKYLAVVRGRISAPVVIDKPIGLIPGSVRRSTRGKNMKMVKAAVTEVFPVKVLRWQNEIVSLVEVVPKTGRTHQIRVHLASIGRPVVGDRLYGGGGGALGAPRQLLHAESLEFSLEDGKRVKVGAEIPEDMGDFLFDCSAL